MKTLITLSLILFSFISFSQVISIKVSEFVTKATFGFSDFNHVMSDPFEITPTEYKNFEYQIDLSDKKSTYIVDGVKQFTISIDSISTKNNLLTIWMTEPRDSDVDNPWKTQYVIDLSNDKKMVYYMWYDNVYDYTRIIIPTKYSVLRTNS
jgi:hypothetical protein